MKEMVTDTRAGHGAGRGPASRTSTRLAGVLMLAATGGCFWQDDASGVQPASSVVLEPNTIRGRVRFTNANPEILALLDSDPRRTAQVFATSTSPTGYSASTQRLTPANLRGFDFEMSVEAAAGGPAGVQYRVEPKWIQPAGSTGYYTTYGFQPVTARVQPQSAQPEPTEVDIAECVGVLRFQWGHDHTCSEPVAVQSSYLHSGYGHIVGTDHYHYVRGGTSGTSTLVYQLGTNPYVDLRRHTPSVSWSAACDEVVTICTRIPDLAELGEVQGPWQVVGEESTLSKFLAAHSGPEGNYRYASVPVADSLPTTPELWWTLRNMIPGEYSLYGAGWLRRGREFTQYYTPVFRPLTVSGGQTTRATLLLDGEERYPLVMHPAYIHGSIRMADPYLLSQPGADSSLEALFFEADFDSNGDGIPNFTGFFREDLGRRATVLRALSSGYPGHPNGGNSGSSTAFPGRFDRSTAELSSTYEHVLPNLYDLPATWRQERLRLGFWSVGTYDFITRPGEYDPARFRYGTLDLVQRQNHTAVLGAGQTHRVDHEYCMNEVQLQYTSEGAPFYNPTAAIAGSYRGADWRGQSADYAVDGKAWGDPAAIGIPQAEAVTYAENSGSVSFAVPQGTYTITPGATLVNADGGVNDATFQPMQVTLGCGQRLKLVPPLAVSVNPQPACAEGPDITVTGRVKSAPATVDRIWYRLNGGPEVTLCDYCGLDPVYSFPVTLDACENTVEVYAYSAGMPEPAVGQAQLVWDDPADGPSCADSTCVNQRPVARCQSVVVAAGDACTGCGSVDAGSYDPDGDVLTCVESASCPYGLGRHRVTLTCTDAHGATDSCEGTVNVVDSTAPAIECPDGPVLECTDGGAEASYVAAASDACSSVTTTCAPASGSRFGLGQTEVVCTAMDASSNAAQCSFPVTVEDTTPPSVTCPEDILVECTDGGGADIEPLPAHASDTCTTAEVFAPGAASYPVGVHELAYLAVDEAGNEASCTSRVIVTDEAVPDVQVTQSVTMWPPNHDLHEVSLSDCGVIVSDQCSGGPADLTSLAITCVTSDEPADGEGPPGADIEWIDDTRVRLRAEREGCGDGRVYHIHFEARDAAGNATPAVCDVTVPHDQSGQSGPAAIDSGAAYSVCR